MSVSKPPSVTVFPWLRDNLGKGCLGVLTNVDIRALRAAVEIVELYSYCRTPEVARAFGAVVIAMQPRSRELAYHSIAHVMDWCHRDQLWLEAGLPPLPCVRVCEWGPGGKKGGS